MPKEWILNQANMRWGLTRKNKVGAVSELIRKCSPKSLQEWENYYYENAYPKQHLEELGKRLYIKISEDVTFKKGDMISVNDPRKQLPELVKSGKMKEETATKILSKLPDFVKFELVYKTQE